MKCTVLGGSGFIGSRLLTWLSNQGFECLSPPRLDRSFLDHPLGHVFYCCGLTADFRQKSFETIEAHVTLLSQVIERGCFDSLLYLSSTRVYLGVDRAHEEATLRVSPLVPSDLYNISKISGESVCFSTGKTGVRVVRVSNVVGYQPASENFLTAILEDAVRNGCVELLTSPDSEKDYIDIRDLVELLPKIAFHGRHNLYNAASGTNLSHSELMRKIGCLTGCAVSWRPNAPAVKFPVIEVKRITSEFNFSPTPIDQSLQRMVKEVKDHDQKH